MFRQIILYIIHPVFRNTDTTASFKTKWEFVCIAWLLNLGVFILCMLLVKEMDHFVVKVLHQTAVSDTLGRNMTASNRYLDKYALYVIVLIGPLIEELRFRLVLDLRRSSVAVFVLLIAYRLSGQYLNSPAAFNTVFYLYMLIGSAISLLVYYRLPQKWLDGLKGKNFRWLFYCSAVYFGLSHINNFYQPGFTGWYLYPFYTLSHILSALIFGAVRMRYGLFYGLLLHMLINLPTGLMLLSG